MNKIRKNLILSGTIKPTVEDREHPIARRKFDDRPVLLKTRTGVKALSMATQQHRSRS